MDEFWTPIASPNPEVLERQLAVLKDWLSRSTWTPDQAACLLAGVCPLEGKLSDQGFAAYLPVGSSDKYLPGRMEWQHSPEVGKMITAGRIAELASFFGRTFSAENSSPGDFVVLGVKFGFSPPWLDYALNDPDCAKHLPIEVTKTTPKESRLQTANRKKALKKRDGDDKYKLIVGAGRAEFERLRAIEFHGHTPKEGRVNKSSVARAILDAIQDAATGEPSSLIPNPRTVERYVSKWLAEDRSDNAGALSDNAGAQVAK